MDPRSRIMGLYGVSDIFTRARKQRYVGFSESEMFNILVFSEYEYMYGALGLPHF